MQDALVRVLREVVEEVCTGDLKRVLARLGAFYGGSVNTTRIRGRKLGGIWAE